MVELLGTAIGLGVVGLDPVGALVAIGALAGGARDRAVVAFGVTVVLVTTVFGTALSLIVGVRLAEIDWRVLDAGHAFWAAGEAAAGAGLLAWGTRRVHRPATAAAPPQRGHSVLALLGTGVLFGVGAVLDPTFVALVVLAGRKGGLLEAGLAHLVWILVSQAPLVVILSAVLTGNHAAVVGRSRARWQQLRPAMARIGTGLALAAGVVLLVDGGWWFVTGGFLLEF